ncbi:uncharacterized protein KIAA1257 homolog isoform X7 [Lemur catta]|uniref:uncharacterized protein KIAA1257 homolog isoform X7 n=1 Tax=Lemur catta TaxID=9447 RepID=UPI001E267CBE|nr:uncharacterized protein KIAA1257 homolog isoform X7 [Lemur catta]
MSLKAWQWEEEDRASLGPISSVNSLYPSPSECHMQECLKATVGSQASDSDFESSSFESSEESGGTLNSDMPQVVPCKFVISLAFPVNMGHKGKRTSLFEKYKKHPKMDNTIAKMRHFYHLEYFLLPDDEEPKEVDMVMFPTVAKVFLESGVKTVKPWREGDKLWVSWAQAFTISMTKELLKKINFHKITLRLWDTKDKLSKKARYYRLKTTTHVDDIGSSEEVRRLVANQRGFSARGTAEASIVTEEQSHEHPPANHEKAKTHSKRLQGSHQTEPETPCKNTEECEKPLKTYDPSTVRWSVTRTQGVSLAGATIMEIKELTEQASFSHLTNLLDRRKSQAKGKDSEGKKKIPKRSKKFRADQDVTLAQAGPWKPSVFSLQLVVTPLLAGEQSVVSRGSDKAANILDCLLMLKTDVPIMTEEQKQDLNPLTIKIKCVSCLPAQPVPLHELEDPRGRAGRVQGALQLAAAVPPPPLRGPGDRPLPRAPVPAGGAAGAAHGAVPAQGHAQERLPDGGQDPRDLPQQQGPEGGDREGPPALVRHDQGPEPGVRDALVAGGTGGREPAGPTAAAGPQPRGLPPSQLRPDAGDLGPPGQVPAVAQRHEAEGPRQGQFHPEEHQRSLPARREAPEAGGEGD